MPEPSLSDSAGNHCDGETQLDQGAESDPIDDLKADSNESEQKKLTISYVCVCVCVWSVIW